MKKNSIFVWSVDLGPRPGAGPNRCWALES